jgi:F-type H+-transporting ATPase subunit epsilon
MNLKVLMPFQIFAEKSDVRRIVADTRDGSAGFLPHRLDCVAALEPGILVYDSDSEGVVYVAVDQGIMVKTGLSVMVSVRNAVAVTDLSRMREIVENEFLQIEKSETNARQALAKIESSFIRQLLEFNHE